MTMDTKYLLSGDCAVVMEFGEIISPTINQRIREFLNILELEPIPGIIEWVPTYKSILFLYNPAVLTSSMLIEQLQQLEVGSKGKAANKSMVVEIPTAYGGEFGPDLDQVARHNGLTPSEVISIHSGSPYLIYMLGFTPGFPYLGGMSEKIATPRLKNPRERILGGSVGIAGNQTGIYPIDSPGGWQLIGRTPVNLFDANKGEPFLLRAGDYLKFLPITIGEYQDICHSIERGHYQVKRYWLGEEDDIL